MRFQVSQVMDAIEQRLTTDVTGAQAVVDLGKIVRNVELDRGRPVSLVRIGMVIDALSRYLVDGGAMLYGVVERALLSESALTSKERMVLGRWADDGLIEVTPTIGDRVLEVADITGLPLIAYDPKRASPYEEHVGRYGWLADGGGRVLRLSHRAGVAVLTPTGADPEDADSVAPVIGRAKVPGRGAPEKGAPEKDEAAPEAAASDEPETPEAESPESERPESSAAANDAEAEPAAEEQSAATPEDTATLDDTATPDDTEDEGDGEAEPAQRGTDQAVPVPVEVFAARGAVSIVHTRISWHRFPRAEPNRAHAGLLRRRWRCNESECPVFGEHRRIGQPVPRLRAGVPTCPRHDEPVADIGPRELSYPVSIVVDDLPRRRLVVRGGRPLAVGRATDGPDEADLASVAPWLHRAATAWISPVHVRLEACDGGLLVTDISDNGTILWQRKGPDDHGTTRPLRQESYPLGEWDSVELYTGIELMRGDRRLAAVLGRDELPSVLLDAPTAAHRQVHAG